MGKGEPVIVLGMGTAGANLVRELARSSEWHLVSLLDDDPAKRGREILGHKVLGWISELPLWTEQLQVGDVAWFAGQNML
ncbi:hypothetical protein EOS_02440 [Caballeronia mineralivorans PML1(12)]|uniref:Uncharacterized protein n=1 Tax=Caballeronia mineralivorans PML1(12) TaxID=908627 RepID=A0A0J1D533_9BURK|nr:hypothetical protein EOS_02440 [Caballeronia mineralivorans PML1(12)]